MDTSFQKHGCQYGLLRHDFSPRHIDRIFMQRRRGSLYTRTCRSAAEHTGQHRMPAEHGGRHPCHQPAQGGRRALYRSAAERIGADPHTYHTGIPRCTGLCTGAAWAVWLRRLRFKGIWKRRRRHRFCAGRKSDRAVWRNRTVHPGRSRAGKPFSGGSGRVLGRGKKRWTRRWTTSAT